MADKSYDKEEGFRELVLAELTEIVDDMVALNEESRKQVFTEENKYCILLTICLEKAIIFGMKDSGFFNKRDFFEFLAKGSMNAKDEYLQQDFNSIQQILLTKSGKARAWIRKTINEGHLATSLYSLASDREFIKSWYEPYAIMSTNAINDLYKEIEKLEEFHFQFNLKDSMLDKDDIFELPPSQYRGQNELVRLKEDTDEENGNDDNNKKSAKKKKKKKKERKERMKRAKSTRNANLNEVVDEEQNATNLTVELDKSMSPISDNDSTPKKKKKKPKKDKKKKKKKKEYSKSSMNVLDGQEQEQDDADEDNEDNNNNNNNDENMDNNNNPDIVNEDEEEIDDNKDKIERKPSLKEWQEQHTSNIAITTPQKTKSEQSLITPVNVNKSKSSNQRQPARPKSGSISDRMKAQLQGITIKMDGNYDETDKEDKPFRISSPSDYHTSFKWNDVSKDISSQKINSLYDHEHNPKNKKSFPDPDEYEEKEKQFLEQLDHDDEDDMDDNELEKQISVLIENAPNDDQEDPELQLSSDDEYDDDDNDSGIVASIPEDIEHDQDMPSKVASNNKSLFYSPKEDKSSTATSATSDSAPYQSQLTESKKEEILNTNDEYHRRKQQSQQQQQQLSDINEQEKYAPECQTFIHFTHNNQNALSTDPTKNSLNIYLQSDNYFDDENQLRDRRKKEQDKESKKRMQREQDVMRGNDSVSIQKSLNSSGMSASGGHDNKPLDNSGNYLVLPSTGIILDATMNKSSEDFFIEQNGQCFSCGDHLGSPQMSRQCYYTQRLYCALCMDGTLNNIVPSKIIHTLDTRKYAISTNSKKHLDSMYDVPAVPLSKIELPSWYIPTDSTNISILKNDKQETKQINNTMPNQNEKYYKLIKLGEYLEILSYIKQYYYNNKECYEINNTVQTALGRRPYLLDAYQTDKDSFGYFLKIIDEHQEDAFDKNRNKANIKSIHKTKQSKYRLYGLISMRDMFELFNKDLLTTMHHTQQQITNHIKSCKHCKKRSYGANVQFISKFSEVLQ